jgi:hypothetical protein
MNRLSKTILRTTIAALALGVAGSAQAAVTYTFQAFSSQGGSPFGKFVYTHPTFFPPASGTSIPPGNLTSCSVTSPAFGFSCSNQFFIAGPAFDSVVFSTAQFTQTQYNFALGTFQSLGNFGSIGGPLSGQFAGLSISTDVIGPGVPEPASWALMLGGFALTGGALRGARRRGFVKPVLA